MAKCSECGFLAVWLTREYEFREASRFFRQQGGPENTIANYMAYTPQCFVRQWDLASEASSNPLHVLQDGYRNIVKGVITKDRICSSHTSWMQGFHPKEHQEMLDRKSERRWRIAEGLIFAVTGAVVGSLVALVPQWTAKPIIPVVNVSPPSVTVTSPPITITMPPADKEQIRAKQSLPPKTTHDPIPRQPLQVSP